MSSDRTEPEDARLVAGTVLAYPFTYDVSFFVLKLFCPLSTEDWWRLLCKNVENGQHANNIDYAAEYVHIHRLLCICP